jgi:hypothetical protein
MKWTFFAALLLLAQPFVVLAGDEPFEQAPISYSTAVPHDAVSAIQAKMDAGEIPLEGDEQQVMRRLLAALGIPEVSQMLVFSKTSFQKDRIDPLHPRAIYFTDEVYVGWSPGGLAEVAAIDPILGPVFYKFDPRSSRAGRRFERDTDCLRCHGGAFVRDIPALLARSVYTDSNGQPLLTLGSELVDIRTPFEQRWGGWYATGQHGTARHRGNLLLASEREPTAEELSRGANLKSLPKLIDAKPYLAHSSDLVALLVFEHQVTVQNALTKANQHCLSMMAYQQGVQRELKEPVTDEPAYDSVNNAFADAVQQVLDALLSKDEAALPPGGVMGSGGFAKAFARGAKPGPDGSSLKDLDLKQRLFKYRCSHLIQSTSFERQQPALKRRVLRRLGRILSDPASEPRYAYLEPGERAAIKAILRASLGKLPSSWGEGG